MSKFYNSISQHYGKIFPAEENKIDFLLSLAKDKNKLLDVACGSGEIAKALMDKGKQVTAIDFEEKMVELAKDKGLDARKMDMQFMNLNDKYDFIYCIGNSLSHLKTISAIDEFLFQMPKLLNENGSFLIQIVNYHGIWDQDADEGALLGELPTIQRDGIKFERQYFKLDNRIRFHTILTTEDGEIENDQILLPIMADKLIDYIVAMGFDVHIYGGFDLNNEFDKDKSQNFIVEARLK